MANQLCMQHCKQCDRTTEHLKTPPNHLIHFLLSVLVGVIAGLLARSIGLGVLAGLAWALAVWGGVVVFEKQPCCRECGFQQPQNKLQLALFILPLLSLPVLVLSVKEGEPKLKDNFTQTSACQTAGYLVRQRLGDKVKTAGVACHAELMPTGLVEINSGYITPLSGEFVPYHAVSLILDGKMKIITIQTKFDKHPIVFDEFP